MTLTPNFSPIDSPTTAQDPSYPCPVVLAPEPARRVRFLKGLLLHWLLPRRYGPHLAVGSFWAALGAHIVAVLIVVVPLGAYSIASTLSAESAQNPIVWDNLLAWPIDWRLVRLETARVVLMLAEQWSSPGSGWPSVEEVIGAMVFGQLTILALATLAMPWCAGGDSPWSVWKRGLKNTYWSTTIMLPIGFTYAVSSAMDVMLHDNGYLLVFSVAGFFWVRMVLCGASRYVGQPVGPGFSPRELHCEGCGYLLRGLSTEGRCPECGEPVRDSLPGGRRMPTPWEVKEQRQRGFFELHRTEWQVLRHADFFRRIPVRDGLRMARHFWWLVFLQIETAFLPAMVLLALDRGGAVSACLRWFRGFLGGGPRVFGLWPTDLAMLLAVAIPFGLHFAAASAGCLWGYLRHGIRDYRVSFTVCCYAAPLMWPVILATLLLLSVLTRSVDVVLSSYSLHWQTLRLGADHVAALVAILAVMAGGVFWLVRLARGLRDVRYANA